MATIGEGKPDDDGQRLRGFLATSVNYLRLLVLVIGEMAKELYQAERQRGRSVEPHMPRGLSYAGKECLEDRGCLAVYQWGVTAQVGRTYSNGRGERI